jgi:riboflavin transporter
MKNPVRITKFITATGMLTAVAAVLYIFGEFPILPAYAFLQYDFSDVAAIVAGIFISPVSGIFVQILKNAIHFLVKASAGGIGDLANLIFGLLFIIPIVLLFKKSKILAFIAGAVCFIGGAVILNYYVFLPLYGIPEDQKADLVKYGILPFNLIKTVITSAVSIVVWNILKPYKDRTRL